MSHPAHPQFWNERYVSGSLPWDFGGVPASLKEFLGRKRQAPPGRLLVPGCGSGHEIKAFADAGYDVTAIDFAPAAVARAKQIAGETLAGRIHEADFFNHPFADGEFDLVYERTFLCAIPPEKRSAYRDRIARLLKPRGQFIGYFYYAKTDPKDGPPYGLAWGEGDELFSRHFLLMKDDPVNDSLPVFAGRERWQERMRTNKPV
ncbi:MAG: hypothetical protein C0502_04350 [Opitutus sp.]|nr:hypothetical protein [Opitutus sp.]